MKVVGVDGVTCLSLDQSVTSAGDGFEPRRLFLDPVWAIDESMEMTGYIRIPKPGRASTLSISSTLGLVVAAGRVSNCEARCPPAEKPTTPTRAGSIPHAAALSRTIRMARCASARAIQGWG